MNYILSGNARYLHLWYFPWSPRSIHSVGFLLCNLLPCWSALDWYFTVCPSGGLCMGGALACYWWLYVWVPFVLIHLHFHSTITFHYLLPCIWALLVVTKNLPQHRTYPNTRNITANPHYKWMSRMDSHHVSLLPYQ